MSTERWILHVDLDQFIAAVEVLRRPELRGLPVIVGGQGDVTQRGVVATASYEARAFGVHSGLPLRTAAKRCPDGVFLPVDREAYEAASATVMDTLRERDAVVEVLGWDEAFLGVDTDDPEAFAREIQQAVLAATELSCSVGIGDNKIRAKLATDFGKPAGMFRLTRDNWVAVMAGRPTDALWGIGGKTTKKLTALGITTVADLARADPAELATRFGPRIGPWLHDLARGAGSTEVTGTPYVPRSHGRETTFQENLTTEHEIRAEVARLARQVAGELGDRRAARVGLKVRFAPFWTRTASASLDAPTSDAAVLESAALAVLDRFDLTRPVRLLGVRAEFPVPDPDQPLP